MMRRFPVCIALVLACIAPASVFGQGVVAGSNLGVEPNPLLVPYNFAGLGWNLDLPLLFIPEAPAMIKIFVSPTLPTGEPILLDATQPFPQLIHENWGIVPGGSSVSDWHEIIITPGWEWVVPGDPRFPTLWPEGQSLITRNGENWPWGPIGPDLGPTVISAGFPAIDPFNVLDIHKALLWVGTPDNRIWGDAAEESGILVLEFPTPEPTSLALLALGFVVCRRTRRA